ncbi:MAG: PAS domain S-box protein, partial [Rhodocyclaceae bacterium]|nr:PAS domain S-box protein [Rhodocyclaceae bacterium]
MAAPNPVPFLSRLMPRTLKTRLAMLVMLSLLAGLWVFTLAVNEHQERRLQELLAGQQLSAVGYVAEDIDNKIRLRLDGLTTIASRFPIADLASEARTRDFLVDRRAIYNLFDGGLMVIKPDGSGAFADYPPVPGRLTNRYDHLAPFRDVIATGKPAVGPPRMGRAVGRPVVVFAVPIHAPDGRLAALLAGVTGIASPNFLDLVAKPRAGTRGDYLVVAPAHGMFVTGTDPAYTLKTLPPTGANAMLDRYLSGYEGSGVGLNSAGVEELSSSRRIAATGWLVVSLLPTSDAFAPIRASRKPVFGAAALLSVLIALITLLVLRRALKPLGNAAAEMQAMTRGDAPLHPLPVPGECEVGILVDSFNRLQAQVARKEDELRLSGTTYRGIFDAVGEAIFVFDEKGGILDINQGAVTMYGHPRAALVGDTARQLSAPERNDRAAMRTAVRNAVAGEPQQFEFWGLTAAGAEILNDVRLYPGEYFGRKAVVAVARDITASRREEEETRRAEQRFSIVFRTSPIAIAITGVADGRFVEVNDALLRLLGRTRENVIGTTSVDIGYWPSAEARIDWQAALRQEGVLHNHEVVLCTASGERRNVLMSSSFIDFASRPCIVNFIHDVTQERLAEESLRLMANIFTHSHDGMLIANEDATIIDVNPAFSLFTGYSREEAVGQNPRFLKSERHDADFYRGMWESLLKDGMWQGEIWNRKKSGELIAEMLTISAVPTGRGAERKYVGIFTDITRLKETQAELEQMA